MSPHRGCNHKVGSPSHLFYPMQFLMVDQRKIEDLRKDQVLSLSNCLGFVLFVVEEASASNLRHSQVVGPSENDI